MKIALFLQLFRNEQILKRIFAFVCVLTIVVICLVLEPQRLSKTTSVFLEPQRFAAHIMFTSNLRVCPHAFLTGPPRSTGIKSNHDHIFTYFAYRIIFWISTKLSEYSFFRCMHPTWPLDANTVFGRVYFLLFHPLIDEALTTIFQVFAEPRKRKSTIKPTHLK